MALHVPPVAREGLPDLPWLPVWKPQDPPFTQGVSTVRLHAADVPAATAWYADLLGARFAPDGPAGHESGGSVTYWQVDDVDVALADLLGRGATVHEDLRDFGGGYRGAVVIDPFGNALGIMQRPVVPTTGSPERKGEAA